MKPSESVNVGIVFWVFISVLLFGASPSFGVDAPTTVRVAENSEVNTSMVFLGDIAAINGEDVLLVTSLKRIEIGNAPLPGRSRQFSADSITIRLKQNNIDLSQVVLQTPDLIDVARGSVTITQEKLKEIVEEFVVANMPWDKSRARVKDVRVSEDVILPKGAVTYKVTPPDRTDYLGSVLVAVEFCVDKEYRKKVWANADIAVLTDVIVSAKPLGRFLEITEDDIQVEQRDLADLPGNALIRIDEAVGKRTSRTVGSQVVLTSGDVELPPLLMRGDRVTIVAQSGLLRITTVGEARERGRKGEVIKVRNIVSKKDIFARVVDSDTVAVDF